MTSRNWLEILTHSETATELSLLLHGIIDNDGKDLEQKALEIIVDSGQKDKAVEMCQKIIIAEESDKLKKEWGDLWGWSRDK